MREAAEKAGIDRGQLLLSLEPEAAAIFCKHIPLEKQVDGDPGEFSVFQVGTTYMVIDAGGGTIDITVHEVQNDGHLKEILTPNGGDYGGTKVDEAFASLLQDITGERAFNQFKSDHITDFLDLMRSFEGKKKTINGDQSDKVTFSIPASLLSTYNRVHPGENITEAIADNQQLSSHVEFLRDKLRLSGTKTVSLFDQSIEDITDHVGTLLRDRNVRDIAAILMVGGYSECPLLIDAIRGIAGGTRLIVPEEAGLVVLKGAVIIGHCPSTISERICKHTYGVDTWSRFIEGKHREDYRVIAADGTTQCKFAFSSFVKKGTVVKIDKHSKTKKYTPAAPSQSGMNFSIYASTEVEPLHVTDESCEKIGKFTIDLEDTTAGLDRTVCVTMCVGGSEIEIKAVEEGTGRSVRSSCDLLGSDKISV